MPHTTTSTVRTEPGTAATEHRGGHSGPHRRPHGGKDTTPHRPRRADQRIRAGGLKITSKPKAPQLRGCDTVLEPHKLGDLIHLITGRWSARFPSCRPEVPPPSVNAESI